MDTRSMFRKLTHITLSILLLCATVGITFTDHLCNCSLSSLSDRGHHSHCHHNMCGHCSVRHVTFQIRSDYVASQDKPGNQAIHSMNLLPGYALPLALQGGGQIHRGASVPFRHIFHSPPPLPEVIQSFRC